MNVCGTYIKRSPADSSQRHWLQLSAVATAVQWLPSSAWAIRRTETSYTRAHSMHEAHILHTFLLLLCICGHKLCCALELV